MSRVNRSLRAYANRAIGIRTSFSLLIMLALALNLTWGGVLEKIILILERRIPEWFA